ncbi:hypothetical protein AGMMS49982_18480 [Bacteroidia bacterium]|nr:hypothetical protein AGMMS49982_18480 [Bacteroidia bacterium]
MPSYNFDYGGQGKAWETSQSRPFTSDYRSVNGDPNCPVEVDGITGTTPSYIVWVDITNSWYTYTVEVADAGEYLIEVDYGAQLPSSLNAQALITVDLLDYYGIVPLPVDDISGWGVHQSGYGKSVYFAAGTHKVKFQILGSPIQYYGLRFTKL